jgi:leucyl-tRNA synthetase
MEHKGNYNFTDIETKWQTYWAENNTFETKDEGSGKPKYYILDMFPYPSGNGLHVGHVEGYTATDVMARYKRMCGFNVLHPMGWDAFGLPAEQYAIKTGQHPELTTEQNIATFKEQLQKIGYSSDWSKEVSTTDPEYYKWTQWIFLQIYKKGLAYESFAPVNWCPELGTVLANEEVIDGRSEVGGFPVEKKPLRQWVLKITEYADRLLDDLELVDWPESTKEMQRNWIGRSTGAEITFKVEGADHTFNVFSTRADTLFGATFCVLAPEHPLVSEIVTLDEKDRVEDYCEAAKDKSEVTRTDVKREKTGVATGAFAINPVNGERLPIFVADYVLMGYGSGAIMAVPGHDERDHIFAKKYNLPIKRVLSPKSSQEPLVSIEDEAFLGDGILVHSDFLNGLEKAEALARMHSEIEKKGFGKRKVNYRLRDWIFSRQRYWGEPFPLAHDKEGNVHLVNEKDLPVTLPEMSDFKPSKTGEPPLSKAKEWCEVILDGVQCQRESNIMPQWAGSCWYYLRYIDSQNSKEAWGKEKERYWLPVDLYVGGVEHANLHLLYARFWHKILYDLGLVSTKEPFKKLIHPGMILGPNGEKMSKSRGNVINPNDVIREWGADSLRLFEMFLGPIDQPKAWQTQGISGTHRFLKRVWRLLVEEDGTLASKLSHKDEDLETKKLLHKTIKKVTEDTENFSFNTAIAAMMELLNFCYKKESLSFTTAKSFVLLLAPYAPHLAEELWLKLGNKKSVSDVSWPSYEEGLIRENTAKLAVMFSGKARGTVDASVEASQEEVISLVSSDEKLSKYLEGERPKKIIYVPGKVINFVI